MITSARSLACFRVPCRLCKGQPAPSGPLCHHCRAELPWRAWAEAPAAFELVEAVRWPVLAAFAYRYPLDRIIARCKQGGDPALLHWILRESVAASPGRLTAAVSGIELVAVPSRAGRLLHRRSDLPARLLAALMRLPGALRAPDAAGPVGADAAQHGVGSRQRRMRASGRFRFTADLSGRRLGLVDDVCTTGATLAALGEAAEAAGARVEVAFVLALTDPPGQAPVQTSRFTTDRA